MRKSTARGRMLPQSLSTDPRYGRLSLKAKVLYPLMWINADDQGRLSGDPDEIKYAACPSVREISADDIPALLQEMETRGMIKVYSTSKTKATQFLDWWDVQKLQWAYNSLYPPPEGWQDKLRYHASPTQIVTENWPKSLGKELASTPANSLGSALESDRESSKEITKEEKEGRKGRGRGRGNLPSRLGSTSPERSPEDSGENPHPHHLVLSEQDKGIYETLKENYRMRWGHVRAENPDKIIPRQLQAKAGAQLRDLAIELSAAGGCPADTIKQAFDEAAGLHKFSISYVRAVLFDWLGIERTRSP